MVSKYLFLGLGSTSALELKWNKLLAIFVLFCCCPGQSLAVQEYPQVSILKWMTAESNDWEFDNLTAEALSIKEQDKENIYTVSQHLLALTIVCNASYPVQWVFNHFEMEMYNIRIKTFREAENIYNVKSFKFSATLEMYSDSNRLTGAYSCQSTSSERIQNNIFVYWLGNSPPYLINAGKTLAIKSNDNKTLVLPCIISSPDPEVILQKQSDDAYVTEPSSPYITFDPQIGFTLNLEQYDSPYGNYKCIVKGGDEDEDFVLMTAQPGIETKNKINNILQGNATFSYDPVLRQIKCCSTSAKPPNLRNTYCEDAISCKLKEISVMQGGNNGVKFRNSSCTTDRVYYRDSGVFRCKGDGIDIVRHFFSGYAKSDDKNDTNPVYFNWADADESKLIEVVSHFRQPGGKIYSNQSVLVSCDTSYYYFAEGIQWALKWRNQTVQFLNESYTAYQGHYRRAEMMHTIKLTADVEMESLVCYAPVWNSTKWVNKTYELKIYQSKAPTLVGPLVEEVHWTLNQTNRSIFCISDSGKPTPFIRWKKNNRVVLNDTNAAVRRDNGSSHITFKRVSHDIQGDYVCVAGNVAGRIEKTIRITVHGPNSSWGTAGIVITTIALLTLAAGLGVLVWKMKLQKKIIDHLAGVVFRDMSPTQSAQTGDR